ncbi:MAG: thioredoxin fold domain-containing protein [Deltaproteobacteria bacterium]|nr:thioredoxin fold domain-containing protein [Deltaproteobacteria bacterium]
MGIIGVFWSPFSQTPSEATSAQTPVSGEIPVKGMPTMVDLGANECVPCKMMVPVMEKVEKKYHGKAAIIFIDVWKDKAPAQRFGIRAIPTQIFFNKDGKEVYRHEGFMSEADIDRVFNKMGVS